MQPDASHELTCTMSRRANGSGVDVRVNGTGEDPIPAQLVSGMLAAGIECLAKMLLHTTDTPEGVTREFQMPWADEQQRQDEQDDRGDEDRRLAQEFEPSALDVEGVHFYLDGGIAFPPVQ